MFIKTAFISKIELTCPGELLHQRPEESRDFTGESLGPGRQSFTGHESIILDMDKITKIRQFLIASDIGYL